MTCGAPIRVVALILGCCLALAAGPKEARRAFNRGLKAERAGDYAAALEAFSEAYREDGANVEYLTRREISRQREAFRRVSEGLRLMDKSQYAAAAREFGAAAELDPSNDFARQQQQKAENLARPPAAVDLGEDLPPAPPPVALRPRPGRHSWNLRGDTRALYLALGAEYGIRFVFDDDVAPLATRLQLEEADFSQAVRVVATVTKTFAAPLDEYTALVAPNTSAKQVQYERQTLKNLDAGQFPGPEAINEVANLLRTMLDMRWVNPNFVRKVISVRDTAAKVMAAERLVRSLARERAEVMIEAQLLEVSSRRARELGLFQPPPIGLSKLSPTDSVSQSGAAVPLPQIFGTARPLSGRAVSPGLATFGGGKSFFGVIVPGADFRARLSESLLRAVSTMHLRSAEGQPATFTVGSRFPIINASFSAIFLTGQALQDQQAGALVNPFPSFTFEDLGIKLKVTPRVHAEGEVTLQLEMQTRALSGQSLNGVPAISNRELQTQVRLADGRPAIVTGLVTRDERRSLAGVPGIAGLPGLGLFFSERSEERAESELLIVITPHVIRLGPSQLSLSESIFVPSPNEYVPVVQP